MLEQLIVAGFGGQGVLLIGEIVAQAGMTAGKQVSWLPAYGPEMRGGTASCSVIVSDEPVGSPLVTDASTCIVLNRPSLDKFEDSVIPGGRLIVNSSLIDRKPQRTDISVLEVPSNEIAGEIGNLRVANMVMLGAYLGMTGLLSLDDVVAALREIWGPSREKLIPINRQALERGAALVG